MKLRFACFGMLALWLGTSDRVAAQGPHGGASPDAAYRGGMVSPPLLKPHFTLPDTSGAPFDFWSKTQGYVTLLFFGFTILSGRVSAPNGERSLRHSRQCRPTLQRKSR